MASEAQVIFDLESVKKKALVSLAQGQ